MRNPTPTNQITVDCLVRDLEPGQRFLSDEKPTRASLMATDAPSIREDFVAVVNLANGEMRYMSGYTRLARRDDGQLYISRLLNAVPITTPIPPTAEVRGINGSVQLPTMPTK